MMYKEVELSTKDVIDNLDEIKDILVKALKEMLESKEAKEKDIEKMFEFICSMDIAIMAMMKE